MNQDQPLALFNMPLPIVDNAHYVHEDNYVEWEGDYFDDPADAPEDWMDDLRAESFIVNADTLREPWIFQA